MAEQRTRNAQAKGSSPFSGSILWSRDRAWVVPGWESPQGVFSHANPNVRCADGTMKTDSVGFCIGV
jgi:hypothetical protein